MRYAGEKGEKHTHARPRLHSTHRCACANASSLSLNAASVAFSVSVRASATSAPTARKRF